MKTVFPIDEVAHLWVHERQNSARNPGGNFYFEGKTIYSYGGHFPIATLHNGSVLMTVRTYSNTTSKHLNYVKQAISHKDKIYCYNPYSASHGNHSENINHFESVAKVLAVKLSKAKKPEIYLGEIAEQKRGLLKYVEHFELKPKSYKHLHYINIVTKDGTIAATENETKEQERAQKAAAKARLEQEVKDLAKDQEKLAAWRKFQDYFKNPDNPIRFEVMENTYLRFIKTTNEVQTSKGIRVSIKVAERFYKWLKRQLQKGACNGECNYKILGYEVDTVNAEFINVGCHHVTWEEINLMAKKLKWI